MAARLNRVLVAGCMLAGGALFCGQGAGGQGNPRDNAAEQTEAKASVFAFKEPRTEDDAVEFIGMSIAELFENFGQPRSVYSSRGIEVWQDDVVFEYEGVDFYIYKDRVWQVSLDAGNGISKGDPRAAVMLVLGGAARDNENHILGKLPNTSWPLEWRFNIENGRVSAIYLYRMDY
jgi:hypothetical protein